MIERWPLSLRTISAARPTPKRLFHFGGSRNVTEHSYTVRKNGSRLIALRFFMLEGAVFWHVFATSSSRARPTGLSVCTVLIFLFFSAILAAPLLIWQHEFSNP